MLLPGLDGTGSLFGPLLEALPPDLAASPLSYPPDAILDYADLEGVVAGAIPDGVPVVLVAESYSGPLALRVAARRPPGLAGVVLVATFLRNPVAFVPSAARVLVGSWLFLAGQPAWVIRRFLVGTDALGVLVQAVQAANRGVHARVLAARVREVLSVDARAAYEACPVPALVLVAAVDRLVSRRRSAEFRASRPGVSVEAVDGPHLLLQTRPGECARRIEDFVRGLS